jgi:hypothetical protein
MQVADRRVWSVSNNDSVVTIVSDLDSGIMYIGGFTYSPTVNRSALFVSQFQGIKIIGTIMR